MRRTLIAFCLSLPAALWFGASQAGADDFWHHSKVDYYRNKCWPEPFIYPDREAYWAPFAAMTANGWQRYHTLGDCHFDPATQRLNRAGEMKLHAILTQSPPDHRTVFVLRSPHREQALIRMDAVQQQVVKLAPEGDLPQVVFTSAPPRTWSGQWTDAVSRGYQTNMPQPTLPAREAPGGN
jgi:hypothetical protein